MTVYGEESADWCEKNDKMVRGLLKVNHLGILEHINFTFHVSEISRALTHQLVRHRLASFLQMSGRHAKPEAHDHVIPQSVRDKEAMPLYINSMIHAYMDYNHLIRAGVPIEDARYVLPPAFFTHISMTMNVRTILHFLELRLAKEAQWEIRDLACKIFDICYEKYPILFESVKELRDENDN